MTYLLQANIRGNMYYLKEKGYDYYDWVGLMDSATKFPDKYFPKKWMERLKKQNCSWPLEIIEHE